MTGLCSAACLALLRMLGIVLRVSARRAGLVRVYQALVGRQGD